MKIYIPLIFAIIGLFFTACDNSKTTTSVNQETGIDTTALINTMGSPLLEELSEKIAANPKNAVLYAQRGQIFYDKDNFEAAIIDLEKAVSLDSTQFGYQHLLADALLDNYESEKAVAVLEKLVAAKPDRFNSLLKLSEFQMILKQHEASLGTIDKLLKQSPRHAEGFYMLGMNFKQMGDTARAINSFQTTVEEDPDHLDAYVELGILFDLKKKKIALQYFDNALRIDSTNYEALFGKAWFLHTRNEYEKADKAYIRTAHFHPKKSSIHLNHGILHLELSELYQDAEKKKASNRTAYKKFDLATKVDPDYGTAYYYLGLCAERLGDKKKAVAKYRQAAVLSKNPTAANEALLRLGEKPITK